MQTTFGGQMVSKARRCYDLTSAVPEEYEAALWKQGDELVEAAALFGDPEAEEHVRRELERSRDRSFCQRELWELASGF